MNKLITNTLIAAGFAVAAAAPAGVQTATPSAPDGGQVSHAARMHDITRGHDERRPFSRPTERVEARLAYIRTALKITDAPPPRWDAVANLLRKEEAEREEQMQEWHARMAQRSEPCEHRRPTAIERIEREQQFHVTVIRKLNERLEVERPLYAALTAEQKQIADELLVPHGYHGMSRQGMGRGKRRWGA